MYEAKLCPFCGGEPELRVVTEVVGHGMTTTLIFVECTDCKARGTTLDTYLDGRRDAEKKAVDFWNRRI